MKICLERFIVLVIVILVGIFFFAPWLTVRVIWRSSNVTLTASKPSTSFLLSNNYTIMRQKFVDCFFIPFGRLVTMKTIVEFQNGTYWSYKDYYFVSWSLQVSYLSNSSAIYGSLEEVSNG